MNGLNFNITYTTNLNNVIILASTMIPFDFKLN